MQERQTERLRSTVTNSRERRLVRKRVTDRCKRRRHREEAEADDQCDGRSNRDDDPQQHLFSFGNGLDGLDLLRRSHLACKAYVSTPSLPGKGSRRPAEMPAGGLLEPCA
jgi:hypothetical protein